MDVEDGRRGDDAMEGRALVVVAVEDMREEEAVEEGCLEDKTGDCRPST